MHTIAMITGATSGIGKDTALLLAKNGFRVIITGRRDDLLKEVTESIGATDPDRVFPLCFDVRDRESVKKAFDTLPENWKRISVLINNAGLASGFEPIHEGDFADWDKMIDTNIKGILNVTYFVSKIMVENRSGHIVNVSSVGGKETYPNGNVYCATKHAVEGLTKAMRLDLLPHSIKVSSIAPGLVNTEFSTVRFHGNKNRADQVYAGIDPLLAEDIAEAILFMVTRPKHVTISDMVILAGAQGSARDVARKD